MSGRNKGYNVKNSQERAKYVKYIKTLDYQPTTEEGLDFDETGNLETDYSIGQTGKPKRLTTSEQLKEHFSKHWIEWLVAGGAIVITFFVLTARIELNKHDMKLDQSSEELKELDSEIEKIKEHDNKQDLLIQENKLRLEYEKTSKDSN